MGMTYCAYHTHTNFSDGADSMEDMVLAAIALGMPALGISDHSDTPCDPSYCMKTSEYPAYLAEMNRLKEKYADRITLLRGLELDYHSDPAITKELDYFLGSVHYLLFDERVYAIDHAADIQKDCVAREFGGDWMAFSQCYFDTLVDHVRKNKPTIVGHFDVITKFSLIDEDNPTYRKMATRALEEVLAVTPVVEVNTGAISRRWRDRPYPADFLLRRIYELGGQVVLGADTHAVGTMDCAFPLAVQRMKEAGFSHMLTLWPDGFREQAI